MPAALFDAPLAMVKRLLNQFFFGLPARPSGAATVQIELALDKVTVVRNDLSEEGWPGGSMSRKDSAATRLGPAQTLGAWFNLTAHFGRRTPPASAKPAAKFTAGPEPGLVARM